MAKGLLVCYRSKPQHDFGTFCSVMAERMKPDNATVNPHYSHVEQQLASFVYNPVATVNTSGPGFCLGVTDRDAEQVFQPGAPRPDGTFALFRADNQQVEVLSDYTASRTIWYIFNDDFLAAATSQRLLVAFLGSFEPNISADSWMLSAGILGPAEPWDKRLTHLPPNSRIVLDRGNWKFQLDNGCDLSFRPEERPRAEHKERLRSAVENSMQSLDIANDGWTLALSGGMDSRSIIHHLRDAQGVNSVTWGIDESFDKSDSDASLAKQLAEISNLPHHYTRTDFKIDIFPTILDRFLTAGEGRVDHISGYMDGLQLWGELSEQGRSIIRGYDAFGRKPPVANDYQARRASGLIVTSDYGTHPIPRQYYIDGSALKPHLQRRADESQTHWRDRLWLEARTPYVTAALDDIKVSYVEIVNPLLCRKVVEVVLTLPEELRINKVLFEEIVAEMYPGLPFARRDSVQAVDQILAGDAPKTFLRQTLLQEAGSGALPEDFLRYLAENLDRGRAKVSMLRKVITFAKASLPLFLENYLRTMAREVQIDMRRLALRAIMVMRMHALLKGDAEAGRKALK